MPFHKRLLTDLFSSSFWIILADFWIQIWGAIYPCRYCPPRFEPKIGSKEPKNRLKLNPLTVSQIGIIGLGLMGGSILKALEGKKEIVSGSDLLQKLDEIDVLFLAVPISSILEIGEKVARLTESRTQPLVVIDIGSVKKEIAKQFQSFTKGAVEFVASHPMAGKHQSGFEYSEKDLFKEAPWVVTPHEKNTESVLTEVEALIRLIGARPLRMSAEEHDRRASLVSHVPYLISKALLEFVSHQDPQSIAMAGPGFQSMTRLAHDNPALRAEIALYNQENIGNTLKQFIRFLETS